MNGTALRIAVLVEHPPRDLLAVKETVDLVLALLALEQRVVVAFLGNGVYHCLQPDQRPERDPSAVFGSLELYDVERLLVEDESLELRGLSDAPLRFGVERIRRAELREVLRTRERLL